MFVFYAWFCKHMHVRWCLEDISLVQCDLYALRYCAKNWYRFRPVTCALLCIAENLETQEYF